MKPTSLKRVEICLCLHKLHTAMMGENITFAMSRTTYTNDVLTMTTGTSFIPDEQLCDRFTTEYQIILGIFFYVIGFGTVFGNILVIVSFIKDKELQTFGNFFILNLAIADLIIGCVICVYVPYFVSGCWHLGRPGCIIFQVIIIF